jgi:oligoribonuclease NrnB/cAMP/cGMP phosphodiesterase (DHH superfamily)
MKKYTVITHGNCADGFTSAWIINKALSQKNELIFLDGNYGDEPDFEKIKGRDVIIADFSYPLQQMKEIIECALSVTVIGHHKTAEVLLKPLFDDGLIDGIFDMDKSGALLTWEWFFPHEEAPELVKYVSDRDLWKFELQDSKSFSMFLFSYEYTFGNWDYIDRGWDERFLDYVLEGKAIERKHLKDVTELCCKLCQWKRFKKLDRAYPVVNLPYTMASDACSYIAASENSQIGAKVGFSFSQGKDGRYYFSIRSRDGTDVSKIAKKFDGGGHKAAAGFVVNSLDEVFE